MGNTGSRGFTLLELLVVLLLLGLVTGLVAPQAVRWLDSAQQRGWRADLKARIETLPVRAFLSGEPLSIDARQLQLGLLGEAGGAELRMAEPLRYSAMGMAMGGRLELVQGTSREVWQVLPVTGAVVADTVTAAPP